MEAATLEKISAHRLGGSGYFPFGFSREPRACPLRVGISLVVANVAYRFIWLDAPPPRQRVIPPLAIALLPVQGGIPAVGGELVPSVGEPKLGMLVAAIADEFEILAIRHAAGSKLEGLQVDVVARLFVIECETCTGCVANLVNAFATRLPLQRRC